MVVIRMDPYAFEGCLCGLDAPVSDDGGWCAVCGKAATSRGGRCSICKRILNEEGVPESEDCGGDCLQCMADVADDPDCVRAMKRIREERNEQAGMAKSE